MGALAVHAELVLGTKARFETSAAPIFGSQRLVVQVRPLIVVDSLVVGLGLVASVLRPTLLVQQLGSGDCLAKNFILGTSRGLPRAASPGFV